MYAFWPEGRDLPHGWSPVGQPASPAESRAAVERLWTGLRPPFPRRAGSDDAIADDVDNADSVVRAFASRVAADPDALAITGPRGTLSYQELWDGAGELAERIADATGGAAEPVAYAGARSLAFPIAVLGTLRAGACLLSLPGDWPDARQREALRDASCRVIVDDDLRVDAAAGERSAPPSREVRVSGADVAYVVFTSGSTGRPKGVLVSHRALANNCFGSVRRYGMTNADRVLQFTGLTVDIALEELFIAWLAGGTVVLAPHDLAFGIPEFSEYLHRWRVSVLDLPVSYALLWIAAIERGDVSPPPTTLKVVAIGSEPVPPDTFNRWFAVTTGAGMANAYGATEQAITSVIYGPRSKDDGATPGVIGTPIPNVTAYVLDEELRAVADGEVGELYISGDAVAYGYLGQPALTAERFLPDPFSTTQGARMYASRDRARRLPDGSLEMLGRLDDRLMVAGHTVEPREVELVIESVAGVERVSVESDERRLGGLVAYVVPSEDGASYESTLTKRITDRLSQTLPPGMRPRIAVGDRQPANGLHGDADVPDAIQRRLRDVWSSELGGQELEDEDNFFDLGGNSLMAIQMLSRVHHEFGIDISFRDFMRAQTLDAFAQLLVDEHARNGVTTA